MKKIIVLTVMPILVALFCTGISQGYDVNETEHLNLVEEANWPPFTPDRYGDVKEGLSYDLMNEIFSRLNISFDIELVPQNRMINYLKSGEKDAATVISINRERSRHILFSEPLFRKTGYIYYLKSRRDPIEWETYDDLKGLKLGVVAGHNYGDEFISAVEKFKLNVQTTNAVKQNFDKLLWSRIDGALCIEMTANKLLKDPAYYGKIVHSGKSYYSSEYHIGFSKKSRAKALVYDVNDVIKQLHEEGVIMELVFKYSGNQK